MFDFVRFLKWDGRSQRRAGSRQRNSRHLGRGFEMLEDRRLLSVGAQLMAESVLPGTQEASGAAFAEVVTMKNTGTTAWSGGANGFTLNRRTAAQFGESTSYFYATLDQTSVASGGTGTFTLRLTAPKTPNTYAETWQMYSSYATGNLAFGPAVTVSVVVPATVQAASLVSKSLADHTVETEGSSFVQSFTLRNSGNVSWVGYSLTPVAGSDPLGGQSSISIPTTAPGTTVTLNVSLKAVKSQTGSPGEAQLAYWEIKNGTSVIPISGTSYLNPYAQNKLWTSITVNPTSGSMIPNLATAGYTSTINPYVAVGNGGQCVAFVWGRVYEALGITLRQADGSSGGWRWASLGHGSKGRGIHR